MSHRLDATSRRNEMAEKKTKKGKKRPIHSDVEAHTAAKATAPKKPDVEAHANLKAPVKAPIK
jgi:Tfp pilus assembly protein FimV